MKLQVLSSIDNTRLSKPNKKQTSYQSRIENDAYTNPKKTYNTLVTDLGQAVHFKKDYAYIAHKATGNSTVYWIVHVPMLTAALQKAHAAYTKGGLPALKKALFLNARSSSGHGHAGQAIIQNTGEIRNVGLHADHTGKGVMLDLYKFLVTKKAMVLFSSSQTKGARKLWYNLSKDKSLQVVATNSKHKNPINLRPGLKYADGHDVYDDNYGPNVDVGYLELHKK